METAGSQQLWRNGPQYYLFGSPGSAACTTIAKQDMTARIPGAHCLLAGPATSLSDLTADLPSGVTMADGHRLTVPQGTVVLQAANPSASSQIAFNSPTARFYVLEDNVALTGNEITDPHQSTDQSGSPDVTFSFNSKGSSQFQKLTAQIAQIAVKSPVPERRCSTNTSRSRWTPSRSPSPRSTPSFTPMGSPAGMEPTSAGPSQP